MEASFREYDYTKSIDRIDEVLKGADASYEERKSIPSKDSLTFDNGFYVYCSALFVDIRGSKQLAKDHTRPVQAKIYKAFISELVAVFKGHTKVNEIYIEGDCVWGIFDTPDKSHIDEVFMIAYTSASLVDILNIKLKKKNYSELTVGIGVSYGESLLIKSGYKGSGINEVVWLGKLVGEAAKLCSYGNKIPTQKEIMASELFYKNLKDDNKNLLAYHSSLDCYHGDVVRKDMNEWVKKNG